MLRITDAEAGDDLDHVRRLFRSYAAESIADTLCFPELEAELAGLPGPFTRPSGWLLVAIDGDHAVGCVAMRDLRDGRCEVQRLYVIPECRRRGVGRALLAEILDRARRAGHRRVVLHTLPEMAAAVALYRACGFVETSPHGGCPIQRAIYLEKTIQGEEPTSISGLSNLLTGIPANLPEELIEPLLSAPGLRIERIVSLGHTTPEGSWYDQEAPEWVLVLAGAARLRFEGEDPIDLRPGAFLQIPAHRRHRVDWTDPTRPTVWLAIHYRGEAGAVADSR